MSTVALIVPAVEPELALGEGEDVGPQPRLEVALHLGQVEVRARSPSRAAAWALRNRYSPTSTKRARHRLAVDEHVLLEQVPAARAHEQRRDLVAQPVLAPVVAGELDRARDRVGEVDLALDDVAPRRRERVLEVGHEAARARVERVDDHLAVDGPGDLDAAVAAGRRGGGGDLPVALADLARLGQEVERLAGGDPRAALRRAARAARAGAARSARAAAPTKASASSVSTPAAGAGARTSTVMASSRGSTRRAAPSGGGRAVRRGRRSAARSRGWRRRWPPRRWRAGCAPCAGRARPPARA